MAAKTGGAAVRSETVGPAGRNGGAGSAGRSGSSKTGKSVRNGGAGSRTATAIARGDAEARREKTVWRRQMVAVALFALSLFFLFVTLIPGERFWRALHTACFGMFGVTAYAWPLVLGAVAVLAAADRLYGSWGGKAAEAAGLLLLTGAAVDIFGRNAAGRGFFSHISHCWSRGRAWGNGGAAGAVIGHPLHALFGHTGAAITVVLLLFVFIMFVTGTTLKALARAAAKPVEKIRRAESQRRENKARFNVDIPLDGEEAPGLGEKGKRLVESVRAGREGSEGVSSGAAGYGDGSGGTGDKSAGYDGRSAENSGKSAENGGRSGEIGGKSAGRGGKAAGDYGGAGGELGRSETGEPGDSSGDTPGEGPGERSRMIERINRRAELKKEEETTGGFVPPSGEGSGTGYSPPPMSLLKSLPPVNEGAVGAEMEHTASKLIETLRSFGVESRIVDISRGPAVTRYELQPSTGVRINRVTGLSEEIAMNLATSGVRIAPIPNKSAIGIEVPNRTVSVVGLKECFESPAWSAASSPLTVALGRDIAGEVVLTDIAKMPHALIAGQTGSGKSVCINSIVVSLLYRSSPDEVKLLLIDPKVVELGVYNGIPHLLVPVVTDPRKAAGALGWAVTEMERRYRMFAEHDVRNLDGYNRLAAKREDLSAMPRIVIIVDELADLMMTAPKDVEDSINRIAAKARAAGMHLILATQRPSVNVVTGVIKANIPARIAFAVASQVDSRTILDSGGAEKLMGRGDMLFCPADAAKPTRVQGCYVGDDEVEAVVEHVKGGETAEYDTAVIDEIDRHTKDDSGDSEEPAESDSMLWQAAECVVEAGSASTSLLQRRLKLGYARAARIVDQLEQRGIVGPYEGSKPREVLLTRAQLDDIREREGF